MQGRKYVAIALILTLLLLMGSNCGLKTTEPGQSMVAFPLFSPFSGFYKSVQRVALRSATSSATIRYTTDGTDPTVDSAVYSGPIDISSSTIIKAIGYMEGLIPSTISSASYTIASHPCEMIYIPGGTFTMGDTGQEGESSELPIHSVTLNPFYMGKYQLTQAEYTALVGSNPAYNYGVGDNYPVYYVNWYSALKYCNLRSLNEGLTPVYTIRGSTNPYVWGNVPSYPDNTIWDAAICDWTATGYRLPTEAEWEYAARGATNDPDYVYSGSDDLDAVVWYSDNNSPHGSKPVGTKASNALGLYDMSGNLYEWCWDWQDSSYYSSSPSNNPTGPDSGLYRVRRGGFWNGMADNCRIASRNSNYPYRSRLSNGFRLCRSGL